MLRVVLLLGSLLGATVASPILVPEECARSSEVWCRDLQAAARCGVVEHCQRAVWSKPAAKSLPCTVCLDVAAAMGSGLRPEATESDILGSLTKTCEWLPSPESLARCKAMVDTHSPAILSMLGGAPGGSQVQLCAALTLCEPLQWDLAAPGGLLSPEGGSEAVAPFLANGALSFRPQQAPGSAVCQDCVQLISGLQEALGSNLSLAQGRVQEQCESLGLGLAVLCKNYIRQLFVPAEQALRLLPPREVCVDGGFCEELRGPSRVPTQVAAVDGVPSLELGLPEKNIEMQMSSGLTCEVCMDVVKRLDQWLVSNSTEALIRRTLERVCSIMPTTMVQQCVTMVDNYSPTLVQLLSGITPEKACDTLRLCPHRRRRLARAVPTPPAVLLDEENEGTFCNGCRRLFRMSAQNLELQSTQRDILMAFKGGCSILPLAYRFQCAHFVTQYEPVFIQSIKEMMEPVGLCKKVGACHAPQTPLLGTDQCVLGPSFWCRSQEAAEMCNALQHCHRLQWKRVHFHTSV
ncbi:proactivator polypeptide-like 1 [Ctenodactylus gundi]